MENSETVRKENKMGYQPIPSLLISMSLPMMISMTVQALYNIVDSVFVAQWSEMAFNGLSLAFPMQTMMIALATGTGVGMNALLSKRLGERSYEEANRTAENGVFLAFLSYLLFALIGVFFSRIFFAVQVDQPEIIEYGRQYLSICLIFSFGIYASILFERLLQSTGRTGLSMVAQLLGAATNLILDPIMIFGYLGCPELGARGAAIATVIGQIVSGITAALLNHKYNKEIKISMRGFRPDGKIIATIYKVGVPSILMQAVNSFTVFTMNKILYGFETAGVTAYGYFFKLESFIFMPTFGMTNGMVPIIAFNYGAGKKKRIVQTVWMGLGIAAVLMTIGLYFFQFRTGQLLQFFNPSPRVREVAMVALRRLSLCFIFAGFGITLSSVFQALGNGLYSLIMSITRQFLFVLPAAYVLGRIYGLAGVWWSLPIAEGVSIALAVFLTNQIYRQKVRNLIPIEERMKTGCEQTSARKE